MSSIRIHHDPTIKQWQYDGHVFEIRQAPHVRELIVSYQKHSISIRPNVGGYWVAYVNDTNFWERWKADTLEIVLDWACDLLIELDTNVQVDEMRDQIDQFWNDLPTRA